MSLILDALNRADRERKSTRVTPDLNTIHEAARYPVNSSGRQRFLLVAAIAVIVLVLWLAYPWLQTRLASTGLPPAMQQSAMTTPPDIQPRPRPQQAPQAALGVQNEPTKAAVISTAAPQAAPQDSATAAEISTLYRQEDAAQSRAAPVAAQQETRKTQDSKVSDLYKPVEEPAQVESVAIPVQTVTPVRLTQDSGKTLDAYQTIPDLSELPASVQQKIPSLRYTRHNFSAEGPNSVVLNGRSHTARTTIAPELSLEEILPDGILLRYQDKKFKLRALNHWINM